MFYIATILQYIFFKFKGILRVLDESEKATIDISFKKIKNVCVEMFLAIGVSDFYEDVLLFEANLDTSKFKQIKSSDTSLKLDMNPKVLLMIF